MKPEEWAREARVTIAANGGFYDEFYVEEVIALRIMQAIADEVEIERERCAKLAEDYQPDHDRWRCDNGCSGEIAKLIREIPDWEFAHAPAPEPDEGSSQEDEEENGDYDDAVIASQDGAFQARP